MVQIPVLMRFAAAAAQNMAPVQVGRLMNVFRMRLSLVIFLCTFFLCACDQDEAPPAEHSPVARVEGALMRQSSPVPESRTEDNGEQGEAREFVAQAMALQSQFAKRAKMLADARALVGGGREVAAENEALHEEERKDGETESGLDRVTGKVKPGATMAKVLENAGSGGIQGYVNAAAKVFPLRSFKAGNRYVVCTDDDGRICRFEYEVNDRRRLVVEGVESPRARMEDIEYVTLLALCEGVIDDSLFQAVADIGENPQLALKLVDLFGSEINFLRHIHEGDSFSILVEKRFREGEYKGYGRILAARFTNQGKTYEAWLFPDASGKFNYYNSKGENLKKALLISPLAFTRLTSKFTHARKHPILGGTRPHLGVDYAAPTGTPVKAVGDGVVTKRGWAGGYGNQIVIRHGAGLESMYAHLSGYARGLRNGQTVKQGQVIGFVGSTGLSTGPHLDFRLRQKGIFINPTKAINPRGEPVAPSLMSQFQKVVAQEKEYLNGRQLPGEYALDSIVPSRVSLPKGRAAAAKAPHATARRKVQKGRTATVARRGPGYTKGKSGADRSRGNAARLRRASKRR